LWQSIILTVNSYRLNRRSFPWTTWPSCAASACSTCLRTYNGKPYFLDAHIDRLEASAQKIGLTLPWSHDEIVRVVEATLAKNDIPEANIRIVVTGGSSIDFMTPSGSPRLLVLVSPIPRLPDHWYTKG
jgi:branched-chain amino acid aminotransferase